MKTCPKCGGAQALERDEVGFWWLFCRNCGRRREWTLPLEHIAEDNEPQEHRDPGPVIEHHVNPRPRIAATQ